LRQRTDHPADDEIEVSVFGPGYGEAVLLHIGAGQWVAIDSCIDPIDPSVVVPLKYLHDLGVDCAANVPCIVATHWHDDHIRGLSSLLGACKSARFCCASAFTRKDFLSFALANATADPSALGNATNEIATAFRLLESDRERLRYVGIDRLLHRSPFNLGIELHSLSPSDERMGEFLVRIASMLPEAGHARTRAPDHQPNDVAVALLLSLPGGSVLLGADLEETPGGGWTAIVEHAECLNGRASVFKVAHHGSLNGHCDAVWDDVLTDEPVAVLTPWQRGNGSLPQQRDVVRILERTPHAYSTATPISLSSTRRENAVERQLRLHGIKVRLAHPRIGHVRIRRRLGEEQWRVDIDGTAVHLKHLLLQPDART